MTSRDRLVLNLSFTITGAVTVLLGPMLPHLISGHGLSDAQAGQLFLAQFLSSTVGAVLLARISKHYRLERCLAMSYVAAGAAVIGLGFAGPTWVLPCVAAYGFALGLNNPAANQIAGRSSPGREAAALNLLNMSWSLGAVLAPAALSYLLSRHPTTLVLSGLGVIAILAGLASFAVRPLDVVASETQAEVSILPSARALAYSVAAFLFLYVGAEGVLSGWLPTHSNRNASVSEAQSGLPQAAFWAAILGGRLFASTHPNWTSPLGWIGRGLALAAVGMAVLLLAWRFDIMLVGAVLAGAGMAPLFPSAVAVLQRKVGALSSRVVGPVFAMGGFGGAVLPWLVGTLSARTGSLRLVLLTALAAAAGMALIARGWRARPSLP